MRPIDGDALKNQIRHMPRTINPDLVQYSLVKAIIADMPTLTPPNEWASVEERLPEPGERVLAAKGTFVGEAYLASNGAWMRHDGFPWQVDAWMPLPAPPGKDNNVPTNEPLTIEQLREMNETPIYVVTETYGSGWCILNWHGVNKSYTYFSRTGTPEGMTATPLSAKTYGDLWTAYRRPPEGEANG